MMKTPMTSATDSGRFETKCAAGVTYIVIEKIKESTESKLLSEQTVVTSRKTYFLLTGEKVNRLTDDDYFIIDTKKKITRTPVKTIKPKRFNVGDIKTIFDFLKNQSLCIAILIAIPDIISTMNQSNVDSFFIKAAFALALSMTFVFSVINIIWLLSSLEDKPRLGYIDVIGLGLTLIFILAAMTIAALKAFQGSRLFILNF